MQSSMDVLKINYFENVNGNMKSFLKIVNPLSAKPTKWPNTPKQFVGNFPTKCLSVFAHFVGLALKGLQILENTDEEAHFFPKEMNCSPLIFQRFCYCCKSNHFSGQLADF